MIKVWVIIFVVTTNWPSPEKNVLYSHQSFESGSAFNTQKECIDAVKHEAERQNFSFCVETYVKGVRSL